MTIARRTSGRTYEGHRALQLFTDRHELIKCFVTRLHEPKTDKLLYFYGDGGNGKSLLLRYLQRHFAKIVPPDKWRSIKDLCSRDLVGQLSTISDYLPIACISHDFGAADGSPKEPFSGLLAIRRKLAGNKLHFPLYDFAAVWYLHKTRRLTSQALSLPTEEMDFFAACIDAVSSHSYGSVAKTVISAFNKHQKDFLTIWLAKRKLDEGRILQIQAMDAETELLMMLPQFLAEDISTSLETSNHNQRIIILFDTAEAFYFGQNQPRELCVESELWFRTFLRSIDLKSVLTVVAGRELPDWPNLTDQQGQIPMQNIEMHHVSPLHPLDADSYLTGAGVKDINLRKAAIDCCTFRHDEIHPLYLGLAADLIESATINKEHLVPSDFIKGNDSIARTLVDRLLRYAGDEVRLAVEALAACRSFDFRLYQILAHELCFLPTQPSFQHLIRFSFVWPLDGRFRIHDLLRRFYFDQKNATTLTAHRILATHYRSKSAPAGIGLSGSALASLVESIYHVAYLDSHSAGQQWLDAMEVALYSSQYHQCQELMGIRSLTRQFPKNIEGCALRLEADYLADLSRYGESEVLYKAASVIFQDLQHKDPGNPEHYTDNGITLNGLARIQATLDHYTEATLLLQSAVQSLDRAIFCDNTSIRAYNNKGNTLQLLGEISLRLSQYGDVDAIFAAALAAYDQVLSIDPKNVKAFSNKGAALQRLARSQVLLGQLSQAERTYQSSINAYNRALKLNPLFIYALNNRASSYNAIAKLYASTGHLTKAKNSYVMAINACNESLRGAPSFVLTLTEKSLSLQGLADIHALFSGYSAAEMTLRIASRVAHQACEHAMHDPSPLNAKGTALLGLGNLKQNLGQVAQAKVLYISAADIFSETLLRAPSYVNALYNKALCYKGLSECYLAETHAKEKIDSLLTSVSLFNQVLALNMNHGDAHLYKAEILIVLGQTVEENMKTAYFNDAETHLLCAKEHHIQHQYASHLLQVLSNIRSGQVE